MSTPGSQLDNQSPAAVTGDHATRMVHRYFDQADQELLVGGCRVTELVREFGSPLFVYDERVIHRKIDALRSTLTDRFRLFYSIKANPNASLLRLFCRADCGLEVASGGELYQALAAGCPPEQIIFAGPGKTVPELAAAVDARIQEIHVESIEEARTLERLGGQKDRVTPVSLRVNPVDSAGGAMRMGGKPSPFGIDEEFLDPVIDEVQTFSNVQIRGIHLFMGTQILDAETLIAQYRRGVSIASRVAARLGRPLETIDFGGGWGTPYFPHERELDLATVARGLVEIDQLLSDDPLLRDVSAIVEPGRFLVNESGIYVSRVTRVKQSRDRTFAVIDGGMHHHLAASGNLGQTIKRNYPIAVVNKLGVAAARKVEVVGPLCTPLDTIGRGLELPELEPGDLIGVFMSGAYARTSSPLGFLSHEAPAEVLVTGGRARLIRRRGTPLDHLQDQVE